MRRTTLRSLTAALSLIALAACADVGKDPVVLAAERGEWEHAWAYELPRANAGVADAQVRIATMYARGKGRPQDMVEAVKFAILASRGQGMLAERISPAIIDLATDEERREGEVRAAAFQTTPLTEEWHKKYNPNRFGGLN